MNNTNEYIEKIEELKNEDFLSVEDSKKSFKELKEQVNKELLQELEQTLGKNAKTVDTFRNKVIENLNSIDKDTLRKMRKAIMKCDELGSVEAELIWISLEFKIGKVL